jgi:hypothetical protein
MLASFFKSEKEEWPSCDDSPELGVAGDMGDGLEMESS